MALLCLMALSMTRRAPMCVKHLGVQKSVRQSKEAKLTRTPMTERDQLPDAWTALSLGRNRTFFGRVRASTTPRLRTAPQQIPAVQMRGQSPGAVGASFEAPSPRPEVTVTSLHH